MMAQIKLGRIFGSRVFRAIVWWVTGDADRATRICLSPLPRSIAGQSADHIAGIITPHEVKAVPRARWPYTLVDEVMQPLDRLHTVKPDTSVTEALETMGREDVNQLPVIKNGRIAGIISRAHILRTLQTRAEMHA